MDFPATNKTTICLRQNAENDTFQISGFDGLASLIISDLNCVVRLKTMISPDEDISIKMLKKGIYIAKIIVADTTIERKLVKV